MHTCMTNTILSPAVHQRKKNCGWGLFATEVTIFVTSGDHQRNNMVSSCADSFRQERCGSCHVFSHYRQTTFLRAWPWERPQHGPKPNKESGHFTAVVDRESARGSRGTCPTERETQNSVLACKTMVFKIRYIEISGFIRFHLKNSHISVFWSPVNSSYCPGFLFLIYLLTLPVELICVHYPALVSLQ